MGEEYLFMMMIMTESQLAKDKKREHKKISERDGETSTMTWATKGAQCDWKHKASLATLSEKKCLGMQEITF